MTPEQLAEIRARYATAPGGSWRLRVQDVHDLLAHVEALEADVAAYVHALNYIEDDISEGRADDARQRAIDVMTPDHPGAALLEENRRLRQEVEGKGTLARAWEEQYKSAYRLYREKGDAWDKAQAEMQRLRARVAELEGGSTWQRMT